MGLLQNVLIWIFIVLFVQFCIKIVKGLINNDQVESFIADATQRNVFFLDNIYNSNEDVYRDSHLFLERGIVQGNTAINNLLEPDQFFTTYDYVGCDSTPKRVSCVNDIEYPKGPVVLPEQKYTKKALDKLTTCISDDSPIRKILLHYQPKELKGTDPVINWFGLPYYRDYRFPLDMIDIKFAANPMGYVNDYNNVNTYPAYVIKKDINAPVYGIVSNNVKSQGMYPASDNSIKRAFDFQAPISGA